MPRCRVVETGGRGEPRPFARTDHRQVPSPPGPSYTGSVRLPRPDGVFFKGIMFVGDEHLVMQVVIVFPPVDERDRRSAILMGTDRAVRRGSCPHRVKEDERSRLMPSLEKQTKILLDPLLIVQNHRSFSPCRTPPRRSPIPGIGRAHCASRHRERRFG